MTLTAGKLRELVSYDPADGGLRWIASPNSRAPAGSVAGSVWTNPRDGKQYRRIRIGSRLYRAHRLVWLHVKGEWPLGQLDHRDGDGLNNRIENLREATHAENQHNRGPYATNKSGFKGVCWHKRSRKWVAAIKVDGRQVHLGYFMDPEAAHSAYRVAAERLHGHFARVV